MLYKHILIPSILILVQLSSNLLNTFLDNIMEYEQFYLKSETDEFRGLILQHSIWVNYFFLVKKKF